MNMDGQDRQDGAIRMPDGKIIVAAEELPVLTIRQPWAWAIMDGRKRVENRFWSTPYRGWMLVHAGKGWDPLERMPDGSLPPSPSSCVFGAILGAVKLTACLRTDRGDDRKRLALLELGPWVEGPKCLIFAPERVVFERPVPCAGALKWWRVSGEVAARVMEELKGNAHG